MKQGDDVAIFWDYENCPAPSSASGYAVVNKIRSITQPYGSIRTFRAYLEVSDQLAAPASRTQNIRSELQCSGVTLVDCPHNGRKDVADKMLIVDMLAYAIDNSPPSTIVLISGDRDFAYALSVLRLRRYRVVLITLPSAHASLVSQATLHFDWALDVLRPQSEPARQSPVQVRQKLGSDDAEGLMFGQRAVTVVPEDDREATFDLNEYLLDRQGWSRNTMATFVGDRGPPTKSTTPHVPATSSSPATKPRPLFKEFVPSSPPRELAPSTSSGSSISSSGSEYDPSSKSHPTMAGIAHVVASPPVTHSPSQLPPGSPFKAPVTHKLPAASAPVPNSPKTERHVPPHFKVLVKCLQTHRAKGILRPLRSGIALEIANDGKTYAAAGVERWKQYCEMAVTLGLVELGGMHGDAWISLTKEWCNVSWK